MFEKILSSIGIGSAKVNTVLLGSKIERGKETKGEVHIFGGKSEQTISKIYIHIDSEFHRSNDDVTEFRHVVEPILEIEITDAIKVKPYEEKIIPFSFFLPYYTPTTFGEQSVSIETELDINFINHPIEHHDFEVVDPFLDEVLSYLSKIGFTHRNKSGVCRHKQSTTSNPTHCLQTFHLQNERGVKINFIGNEKDINIFVTEKGKVSHLPLYRDGDLKEQLESFDYLAGHS